MKKFNGKLSSKWKSMAWHYVTHPTEFARLIREVKSFASRDGLRQVKGDFDDMYHYVKDVSTGRYKGFNMTSLLLIVAAFVYLVTPADLVPDFIPGAGLVDDVSILAWAAKQVVDEIEKYKQWLSPKIHDDIETIEEIK